MNNLSDNEIIKALKCCTGDLEGCASCPLYDPPCDMGHKLNYYALDLINRQKAEIERLCMELDEVKEMVGAENGEEIKPTELH